MYVFTLILLQNIWGSTSLLLKCIHTSCLDVMCELYIRHFLFVLNMLKVFLLKTSSDRKQRSPPPQGQSP